MLKIFFNILITFALFAMTGCADIGKPFDPALAETIVKGKTTLADIQKTFGEPFKKGIQNGDRVWVYEYNEYKGSSNSLSKNLTVVFDDNDIVKSHQTMSTSPKP
jgi:hypothetical protein